MKHDVVIPVDPSVSFAECLWFLDRNFDECMHSVGPDSVRKALLLRGRPAVIELRGNREELTVDILHGPRSHDVRKAAAAYVRDWLDTERDIAPFYSLLGGRPELASMAKSFFGLRLVGIPDLFEALCWAVIGQQINLPFAYAIKRRLVERYGSSVEHGGTVYSLFPTAETLADASADELRAMKLSGAKAGYLLGIAQAFAGGAISREILQALPDVAARRRALTALKGVGAWTADYALMKSLKEPTSVPHGDAGLIKALRNHGLIRDARDRSGVEHLFREFAGWESYLVLYLWRSLTTPQRNHETSARK